MALEMWSKKERFGKWFRKTYGGPDEITILPDENVRRIISRGLDRDPKLSEKIRKDYTLFKLRRIG